MYKCININCVQKKAFSSIKITIYKLTKTSTVLSVLSLVFRMIVGGRAAPKLNIRQAKTRKQSNPFDRREHMYSYKRIFFYTKGRPSFLPVQRWEFIKENKKVRKKRKKELDQERDQEKKKTRKKTRTRPRKLSRKKEVFSFFLGRFLVFLIAFFVEFFFLPCFPFFLIAFLNEFLF